MNPKRIFYLILSFHFTVNSQGLKPDPIAIDCLRQQLSSESYFVLAAFTEIDSNTTVESLSDIYAYLKEVTDNKLIKNLEAKRLINSEDWEKASSRYNGDTWRAYGDLTINAWFKGREYVLSLPKDQPVDSNLLKEIHKIVSENHKFHGFEGRRILSRFQRGEISRKELDALAKRAFENNEEIAGVSHSSLRGQYRQDSVDQIEHRGSSFTKTGSRYFTENELKELRKNKYIKVDEESIKKTGKNSYTGKAFYEDVSKVEDAIKNILETSERKLKEASTSREIIEIVVMMEKDLISVHPFLDGNGRSIRLLGDYVLSRYNLPPSLYPNESDLTMPLNEAVDFRVEGMKDYLKEHQKYLKKY